MFVESALRASLGAAQVVAEEASRMTELNPTLADGLWAWRQHLTEAAMIISTLVPEETIRAAKELARDLARDDRTVVLTALGASEPLFWHVPAGRELDTVKPDLVLLLVQNQFTASTRLLLATASHLILLTGSNSESQAESLKAMQLIIEKASPSRIEIVVVADQKLAARDACANLVSIANRRFGDRTTWRHLAAQKIRTAEPVTEEEMMNTTRRRSIPISELQVRTKEWEQSFRRAEELLREAQETLSRQLSRPAESTRAAQLERSSEAQAQAL